MEFEVEARYRTREDIEEALEQYELSQGGDLSDVPNQDTKDNYDRESFFEIIDRLEDGVCSLEELNNCWHDDLNSSTKEIYSHAIVGTLIEAGFVNKRDLPIHLYDDNFSIRNNFYCLRDAESIEFLDTGIEGFEVVPDQDITYE